MKKLALTTSLMALLSISVASAQLLYFDDFGQFPNGTVLTDTNYVPGAWIPPGASALISTNNGDTTGASAIASNLLGSIRLFANVPADSQAEYDARLWDCNSGLAASATNQVVTVNWLSWFATTKSLTATGGLAVGLSATNLDDCCNGLICLEPHSPHLFFSDSGSIYVLTNDAENLASSLPVVRIGSWSSLVGQIMTNVLTLNYPARKFSFSLNGTVLTNNMSLPRMFTNIFTEVDFYGTQIFPTSAGDKFALDNLQILVANTNSDVHEFLVAAKGQQFNQTSSGTPSHSTTGWVFYSEVQAVQSDSVWMATLHFPTGAKTNLEQEGSGSIHWSFTDPFFAQANLDAAHGTGVYRLAILGANQGLQQSSMTLSSGSYPNTPQISNFDTAQVINASQDFTLQWNTSGGGAADWVMAQIYDSLGNTVVTTPDFGRSNALNGTVTSLVLTAGTLQASSTYQGDLVFARFLALDSNSVSGAIGGVGYYNDTQFPLATISPPQAGPSCVLTPALATNDVGTLHTVTATVTTNTMPVSGVTVNFTVLSGPDVGTSAAPATDSSGTATFGYTGATNGTDLIQASGTVNGLAFTGTAVVVWLPPEILPVAVCQNPTVPADAGCQAAVTASQVDNGSYARNGGSIVGYSLTPPGPYSLGVNSVTLTVTDNRGGTNSCSATITVVDQTPPTITCSSNLVVVVPFGATNGVVDFSAPTVSDNCSVQSTACLPTSGSVFPLGTNTVTCTAVDGSSNTNQCSFQIVVTAAPAQADLAVTGTSSVTTASLNNAFSYTLVVTNNGPQAAPDAQLVDSLPTGSLYSNATTSVGSCTNIAGVLTCDFDTLADGATATVTVWVTPTNSAVASACSTASVTNSLVDPVAANNSATVCTPVVIDNLAVTAFTAPKKVTLSAKKTNVVAKLSVTIQNRSLHTEVIRDLATLSNLVTVELLPLGPDTNSCPSPVAQLVPPKKLPITLAAGKTAKLAYTVHFTCATDPLATTKSANHNDYQYLVTVHHAAIDGVPDSYTADDACPHNALGVIPYTNGKIKDKGCGLKNKDRTFGPVVTDIVDKRP